MTTCASSNPDITAIASREGAAWSSLRRLGCADALATDTAPLAFVRQLSPKGPTP